MSNVISLVSESQVLIFTPLPGAEVKYRPIGPRRYQEIIRECRIDDRGPAPVDKTQLLTLLREIIAEDGQFRDVDEEAATKRLYSLLMVGQQISKTDWPEVKNRTLLWSIQSWSGIGYSNTEGTAPLNSDSVAAFAETEFGDQLFALVLKDITAQKMKAQGIDPLQRSGSTSSSASNTAGDTAKGATTTTRKVTGSRRASAPTKKPAKPAASATSRKNRR